MTAFDRVMRRLARLVPALVLALGLAVSAVAQEAADPGTTVSGGAAPGPPGSSRARLAAPASAHKAPGG